MACIASNPDVSGIGVRTAIYAQNILSFAQAIFALLDKDVSPTELDTLETQSTTILITAFAILVSTIVQALTDGITNYHAAIILNLSWMNNTNLFIYMLLYVHHRSGRRREDSRLDEGKRAELDALPVEAQKVTTRVENGLSVPVSETKKALTNPVFIIGSLHLTLMAAVGIWLWSRPASFANSPSCSLSASIVVVGQKIGLASPGLRNWSILIYSLLLTPVMNLLFPVIFFLGPIAVRKRLGPSRNFDYHLTSTHIFAGLAILAVIDVILLVDTEVAIHKNKYLIIDSGDNLWTFGQTLALLLLLVPLRDLGETLIERRPRKLGKKLLAASEHGELRVAEYLVRQGPDVPAKDGDAKTPLHLAAGNGHVDAIESLFKYNVDTEAIDCSGQTPLDLAVAGLHDRAIISLLGGRLSEEELNGGTALHWVAGEGLTAMALRLTRQGTKANATDRSGRTPLYWAGEAGHVETARCLVESQAKTNPQELYDPTALHWAVKLGNADIVETLIEHGADINMEDDTKHTPLLRAAALGHAGVAECLLKRGAEKDRTQSEVWGYGELHLAARGGHLGVVQSLIQWGANIDIIDKVGITPLHLAAKSGHFDVVKYLVESGADIHKQKNMVGDNALHFAVHSGRLDIVRYLVEQGMRTEVNGMTGWTAITLAKVSGHPAIVDFLNELEFLNQFWFP